MQIKLNLKKTLEQNAAVYFEKAKKLRKKAEGAKEAVQKFKDELAVHEDKTIKQAEREAKRIKPRTKLEWYEKFRWFLSSNDELCIGGRDAVSNEVVVKKHTESDEWVFHTEAPGSPFFVIKDNKEPSDQTKEEVAIATASFSRAWRAGVASAEVFCVKGEQVSKKAPTGTYLPKGSFMVNGKRELFHPPLGIALGQLEDGRLMSGPESAVKKHCKEYVRVLQGKGKTSDAAKKLAKKFNVHPDDVMRSLPSGGCEIKESKR